MNDNKQNNDDFHSINEEITPTSNDQSRISYRKKFVWITIGVIVILIILSISISLPIVMKKKKNVPQITAIVTTTTTTTAAITTEGSLVPDAFETYSNDTQ
ncbi:unnamed protein product [Adineta steineri]|uniref:Uncharacterized protein n=1 Tax=Adineta steineri TaxID=433720 RepID=A0A814M1F9_9BILA|nr:unnamed protein product [Adineta steineri]